MDWNKDSERLLLYNHPYSYYSQKVSMTLYEKKLKFNTRMVNITKGEHLHTWYLKLNPLAEVPVLKDGDVIIPDSAKIIDYLEDKYTKSEELRLIPVNDSEDVYNKVLYFRQLIDTLPAAIITVGSFINTENVGKPKIPFIAPVRRHLVAQQRELSSKLRALAKTHTDIYETLLDKAERQDEMYAVMSDQDKYQEVLNKVDTVLEEIENQLKIMSDKKGSWLCCERFTTADISLIVLLDRLYYTGLDSQYWINKRPHIAQYYSQAKARKSYKATMPTFLYHTKTFIFNNFLPYYFF